MKQEEDMGYKLKVQCDDWPKVIQPRTGSDPKWPDSKSLGLVNSQVAASGVGGAGRWRPEASVLEPLRGSGCHLGD